MYPLHYDLCRRLYKEGVSEEDIARRLRIRVTDVRDWSRRVRFGGVRLFRQPPEKESEGGE